MGTYKQYSVNTEKFLTLEETEALMLTLKKYPCRDASLIEVLLKTGARAQEFLNIKLSDINQRKNSVFIRGLKGSNDRTLFLKPETMILLLSLYDGQEMGVSYKTLQRAWYKFRPSKKKLHSLRHSYAVNLYEATKDTMLVKKALGHRSINSTMVYVDLLETEEKMKAVAL